MKSLSILSRIVVGLVFIFSGFVKAVDPLGSAYKFHDYFMAFDLGFLNFMSLPLAILLCTAEFIAGFAVLTGIKQKAGTWVVLLLMAIFTPLTFILALTNPVSDCGCFGDAVHLTNWQTFGKNIILLALAVILFITRKQAKPVFKARTEWSATVLVIAVFVLFNLYNLKYLPVIDFLPYEKGVKIADQMIIPEGVQGDQYNTTFIYEKDGIKKEFDLTNYPANDTSWIFVDQKSVLVKKGFEPPIHDFTISAFGGGVDLTQKILTNPGYTLLMISKKLTEADKEKLGTGFETGMFCVENGVDFYIITASGSEETSEYLNELNFCTADETTLKTMVRSNPGYLLLKDGVIEGKWSWANLPDKNWFKNLILINKK